MKRIIVIVIFSFLFFSCFAQKHEWRKPDVSSQEHFLAGNMISFTTGLLLNQGLNFKYGSYIGILAGSTVGYCKEKHDPIFDNTDLLLTITGSILGGYLSNKINKYYGLSDQERIINKINRLNKRSERRMQRI
ncbi:MAG: hypothetical protein M0R17_06445 [Candidatus Omnitrophica bacterium]|jgi:hypothetical protein|nr:hypothetical protein [Candidatus Omnitrophota bacterium]